MHSISAAILCDLVGQSLSQTCPEQVAQNLFVLWKHTGVQLVAVNDRELFWPAWAMVSLTAAGWKVKDVSAGVTASGNRELSLFPAMFSHQLESRGVFLPCAI